MADSVQPYMAGLTRARQKNEAAAIEAVCRLHLADTRKALLDQPSAAMLRTDRGESLLHLAAKAANAGEHDAVLLDLMQLFYEFGVDFGSRTADGKMANEFMKSEEVQTHFELYRF